MNKYMLLAVACIISQGLSAQVELGVTVNDQTTTIVLNEQQAEICEFENVRVAVRNVREDQDSVALEVIINKDEQIISAGDMVLKFEENPALLTVESDEESTTLEIIATKK